MNHQGRLNRALATVAQYDEPEEESSAIDALSDLLHLAESRDWDIERIIRCARMHHTEESDERAEASYREFGRPPRKLSLVELARLNTEFDF